MNLWEGVRLAMTHIRSQKLKSFFSVLGVVIGVMFLLVVVSVVEGMDRYIREDFSSKVFGINTVTIHRNPTMVGNVTDEERRRRARSPRLRVEEADALREGIDLPVIVGVESSRGGEITSELGLKAENARIMGVSPEYFQIRTLDVMSGRVFTGREADRGAAVVVLGSATAEVLFPDESPLGKRVRVAGRAFRVIGVLEEQGSLLGQSQDNLAIAPHTSAVRTYVNPIGIVDQIQIQTATPEMLRDAASEAEGVLRVRRRLRPAELNNFAVETADQSLSFWDTISRILFLALPGLVAISLVVGGIVIMNIMLVSVMERTREIGVRKALGARRRDILTQVLIESSTLSGLGALLGVGIGIGLTWIVRAATVLPAAIAPHWVALGVALGVVVGIVAGVYPASRAAKLDPVDALRYE